MQATAAIVLKPLSHPDLGELHVDKLLAIGRSEQPFASFARELVIDLSRKHAVDAYGLAEQHEANPRSVWGYVQGLTRLSQRTPWQDARFALDRAASRLLTLVH